MTTESPLTEQARNSIRRVPWRSIAFGAVGASALGLLAAAGLLPLVAGLAGKKLAEETAAAWLSDLGGNALTGWVGDLVLWATGKPLTGDTPADPTALQRDLATTIDVLLARDAGTAAALAQLLQRIDAVPLSIAALHAEVGAQSDLLLEQHALLTQISADLTRLGLAGGALGPSLVAETDRVIAAIDARADRTDARLDAALAELRALRDTQWQVLIDFGNAQLGDVTIGDVAGRDIHKPTLAPGAIYAPGGTVVQPLGMPLWAQIAAVTVLTLVALLISLFVDVGDLCRPGRPLHAIFPCPPPPLDDGFNIVVTEFAVLDSSGKIGPPDDDSRALSSWLTLAIENDARLANALAPPRIRGPSEADPLPGDTRARYIAAAPEAAIKHNATILIYGLVTRDNGNSMVELGFYVRDEGFSYGGEIAGPGRLGDAIPFQAPLDVPELAAVNARLKARSIVLQRIATGLSYFYTGAYTKARAEFDDALDTPEFADEDGKEVLYTLMGAAQLRQDKPTTPPAERLNQLVMAAADFQHAATIRPEYARSYLGLGAVAVSKADAQLRITPSDKEILEQLLREAQAHYQRGRDAADKPESAYVETKVAYGMGQVQLLGATHGLADYSYTEADRQFNQVLNDARSIPTSDLAWFAGNAHAYLALIANHDQDWSRMADEGRQAITTLMMIPVRPPQDFIALYWSYVGYAEAKQDQRSEAIKAYENAISIGRDAKLPLADIERWEKQLNQLKNQ